jgi:hypothetical protein
MRGSARRAGRPPRRLARQLLGRNELRRAADRIETAIVVCLVAAFLTAVVAAACLAWHLYQSEYTAAAGLRPGVAVLSQPGPAATTAVAAVGARWRLPNGTERSGTLTTVTAPPSTRRQPEPRSRYGWTAPESQPPPGPAPLT